MYYKTDRQRWDDAVRKFWSNVDVRGKEECWDWKGGRSKGYGESYNGKISVKAYKMSWMISYGTIPKIAMIDGRYRKVLIRHRCGNRLCVNPNHLELGTYSDNAYDVYRTGDSRLKLSEDAVKEARRMKDGGRTYREIGRHFNTSPSTVRKAILGGGIYGEVIDDKMVEKMVKIFN